MKKIFTLIAAAVMAVSANAQVISFSEAADKGTLNGKTFEKDGFALTITDSNDDTTKRKVAIDANKQYFGTADNYQQFEFRLKTGGKSDSKNHLDLTIPASGTLNVYVRTSSSSAKDRNLVLTQNDTELFNKVIKENEATDYVSKKINDTDETESKIFPAVSVQVAEGSVAITYPVNGLNFYGFEFVKGGTSTGINNVAVAAPTNNAVYNLAGQKVGSNFKGIVIKNGKKMIQK